MGLLPVNPGMFSSSKGADPFFFFYRLVLVALVLCSPLASATPDAAVWRAVSVLGANNEHYFVLVTQRDYPGSYYSYRERIFVEKHITKLNRKVFSAVISDIQYTNADPEKYDWKSEAKPAESFDLAGYIKEEKIKPLYPNPLDPGYRIVYQEDGLHLETKNRSLLLRPLGSSRLEPGELAVPGIYYTSGFFLLKVSQGDGARSIDQDYLEMVLPISRTIFNRAKKELSKIKK